LTDLSVDFSCASQDLCVVAMALRKSHVLVGALLLVTTCAKRIKLANKDNELTPDEESEQQDKDRAEIIKTQDKNALASFRMGPWNKLTPDRDSEQRRIYKGKEEINRTKEEYAVAFLPAAYPGRWMWRGVYVDMFSPDDTNPFSRRYIDFDEASGELQISADTGAEKWGRRFDKTTSVNPILTSFGFAKMNPTKGSPNSLKTSFLSKVPKDAPEYAEAQDGALNFTLTMGTAFGKKVIKWNGLYDGKGGKFAGEDVPPTKFGNFWRGV